MIPPFDKFQFLNFLNLLKHNTGNIPHGATIFNILIPDIILPVYTIPDIKRAKDKSN